MKPIRSDFGPKTMDFEGFKARATFWWTSTSGWRGQKHPVSFWGQSELWIAIWSRFGPILGQKPNQTTSDSLISAHISYTYLFSSILSCFEPILRCFGDFSIFLTDPSLRISLCLVENNKQKELSLIYPVEFTHLLLSVMPIKDRKGNIQRIHANTTFVNIRRNVKIGLCERRN